MEVLYNACVNARAYIYSQRARKFDTYEGLIRFLKLNLQAIFM
jgi:hypothetical protein